MEKNMENQMETREYIEAIISSVPRLADLGYIGIILGRY